MAQDFDSVDALNSALVDTRGDEIVLPGAIAQQIADELRSIVRLCGVTLNYSADLIGFKPVSPLFSDYNLSRRDATGILVEIKAMRDRYQGQAA